MQTDKSPILEAVLLGPENRQLSTGQAQFLFSDNRGVYWPHDIRMPANLDKLLKSVEIVQTADGQRVKPVNLKLCPSMPPVHFDFDIVPSSISTTGF